MGQSTYPAFANGAALALPHLAGQYAQHSYQGQTTTASADGNYHVLGSDGWWYPLQARRWNACSFRPRNQESKIQWHALAGVVAGTALSMLDAMVAAVSAQTWEYKAYKKTLGGQFSKENFFAVGSITLEEKDGQTV